MHENHLWTFRLFYPVRARFNSILRILSLVKYFRKFKLVIGTYPPNITNVPKNTGFFLYVMFDVFQRTWSDRYSAP